MDIENYQQEDLLTRLLNRQRQFQSDAENLIYLEEVSKYGDNFIDLQRISNCEVLIKAPVTILEREKTEVITVIQI